MAQSRNLEDMIEQNLAAYIEANSSVVPSDFKVKRELSIARHALEESLTIHHIAITTLKAALANINISDPGELAKLITLTNHAEERSNRLTQNAKTVAGIAKIGAEVEALSASKLDAVQIYSIIAQLPTLLLTLINSILINFFRERNYNIVNGKVLALEEVIPEISNLITNAFNDELENAINVLTYRQVTDDKTSSNGKSTGNGVIEAQVVAMLNTVPTHTSVISPDSQLAQTINELDNR